MLKNMRQSPAELVRPDPIYVTRPGIPPLGEYVQLLRKIWGSRILTNHGPLVVEFERRLKRYLRASQVDVVANGTLALQLLYKTLFRRGFKIITTPFTFVATTTALLWEGMTPVFVDIDPGTFNLDTELVKEQLEKGVDGLVAVHVFGNPAGCVSLSELSKTWGIPLIFDAAHAFGVRVTGDDLFELGDASALSFHATKNFHTFEGGAVVSSNQRLSHRVRLLRNFGIASEEKVEVPGINAKMSEAHAAMGVVNLRYVDRWIKARKERYDRYVDLLARFDGLQFQRVEASRYNYAYMPVVFESRRIRDGVYDALHQRRIYARKYFYPMASRLPFSRKFESNRLPVAQRVSQGILTLPLYPDLSLDDVDRVSKFVLEAMRH